MPAPSPVSAQLAVALAAAAPGPGALAACVALVDWASFDGSVPAFDLARSPARLDAEAAAALWRSGRSRAPAAAFAAATCSDPALLTRMAARERRQGVLHALAWNPSTPLADVLVVEDRVGSGFDSRSDRSVTATIRARVHAEPPSSDLFSLCAPSASALRACASHPLLTVELASDLLAAAPQLAAHLASRPDLPDLPDLVPLLRARPGWDVDRALASHVRLLDLGPDLLLDLAASPAVWDVLASRSDLPTDVLVRVLSSARVTPALWRTLALNPAFPAPLLDAAPLLPVLAPLLARRLADRFGDDREAWELATSLAPGFAERTVSDLLDAVSALLSSGV